ncbi:hypothetical protein VZT92_024190 [Zoarces viviparus]|uniref:NADH dehydrogenase subunit 4 n=1 Tax=Zoarces viviparus TaxID=48416 RepID=A0AAW1E189_ZOAVI
MFLLGLLPITPWFCWASYPSRPGSAGPLTHHALVLLGPLPITPWFCWASYPSRPGSAGPLTHHALVLGKVMLK